MTASPRPEPYPDGPLADLRVWDTSWVGVGPLTTKYLADYGATVLRTESSKRPDGLRLAPPFAGGEPGLDRSQFFAAYNTSKQSVGVDLTTPGGHDVALRLAAWADVVVEAYSPGVMTRLGLGYDDLRAVNPGVIMVSTSMNGQTGPRRSFAGFGTVMSSMAGFTEVTGWPDREPCSPYGAYTDFVCQRLCALAVVAAIDHRDRTGEGQHIDLAQYEGALQFMATWVLDAQVNARDLGRHGDRDPFAAPHGVYPAAAPGPAWVAITVETDDEWRELALRIGRPDLAADGSLAHLAGRRAAEDAVDDAIKAWTSRRSAAEVVRTLQPAVIAAPVNSPEDLLEDEQIRALGYFQPLEHPVMGTVQYEGPQARVVPGAPRLRSPGPVLAGHTRPALHGELGYSEAEIDALLAAGAIEDRG